MNGSYWIVYLPFGLAAAALLASRVTSRRASPAVAAGAICASMLVLAASTLGSLALLAWPLVARSPFVAVLHRWRTGAISERVPVSPLVSATALALLAAAAARMVMWAVATHRQWRARSRVHAGLDVTEHGELVVVEDDSIAATALAPTLGHPGRILVSARLLPHMGAAERQALLAHERSHIRNGHHLYIAVADLAVACNPLLAAVRHDLMFALERWADEDAAARAGRSATARTLAIAGVAQLASRRALAVAGSLDAATCRVAERIVALRTQPRWRSHLVALLGMLALAALVAVALAAHDTDRIFDALRVH